MEEKKFNMIEPVENNEIPSDDGIVYRKCKSCGCLFPMTVSKLNYFKTKWGTVPNRCYNCRQKYTDKTENVNK